MSENQPPSYPGDDPGQQPNDPSGDPQQPSGGQQPPGQPYGAQQPYQQPPGQPYGAQQPYGGQQPYGAPGQWQVAPKHPKATLVLVLGILGLVVCQVLGPFAWVMGNRAVAEIDANPGVYDGRGEAQAGRILGIIATVILILSILVLAFFVVLIIIGVASSTSDYQEMNELSLSGLL
ncbi:DUF4190 domain-containing protein [Aeromicrobium sp.]|uniref:DUF4190 domain-containing protein n=1 Tax=Aeromicrobium sp. TaxID=1871063 RepID=UPI0028A69DF0|nr:DUF4190 domain-containing protein [Aeromicrobium sp.]